MTFHNLRMGENGPNRVILEPSDNHFPAVRKNNSSMPAAKHLIANFKIY